MAVRIDDLPSHLMLEILTSGRLSAVDLVCAELASAAFRGSEGVYPLKFRSLVNLAAAQLCASHPIFFPMSSEAKGTLFNRCDQNWKRVLRFLQSVQQASDIVETSEGNVLSRSCSLILVLRARFPLPTYHWEIQGFSNEALKRNGIDPQLIVEVDDLVKFKYVLVQILKNVSAMCF